MSFLSDLAIDAMERLGIIPPSCDYVRIHGKPLEWRIAYGVTQAKAWHKIARDPHPPAETLRAFRDAMIELGIISVDCCEADLIFKRGEPARVIATSFLPQRFIDALTGKSDGPAPDIDGQL